MSRKLAFFVCILFAASGLSAATKDQKRLENSGTVMKEILNVPDDIPAEPRWRKRNASSCSRPC